MKARLVRRIKNSDVSVVGHSRIICADYYYKNVFVDYDDLVMLLLFDTRSNEVQKECVTSLFLVIPAHLFRKSVFKIPFFH